MLSWSSFWGRFCVFWQKVFEACTGDELPGVLVTLGVMLLLAAIYIALTIGLLTLWKNYVVNEELWPLRILRAVLILPAQVLLLITLMAGLIGVDQDSAAMFYILLAMLAYTYVSYCTSIEQPT